MEILSEVYEHEHLKERTDERFTKGKMVLIGYNDNEHRGGDFVFVGEGPINDNDIDIIKQKIKRLKSFNVDPNKSFGVKMGNIKPNLNTIKFYDGFNKENIKYKDLYFIFREDGKNSGGNTAYIIVRNNVARTIMYSINNNLTPKSSTVTNVYRDFDEFVNKESLPTIKEQIKEEIRKHVLEYLNSKK